MNAFDLSLIAKNVEFINGIWYSKGTTDISYPDDGNSDCFQIEDTSFWFKHRNSVILSLIQNFKPKGYIFDIGGGNGFVTKGFQDNGFDSFLVEPGLQGIKNGETRGILNLLCSTLEDAQFNEKSIPAIGIFDVLEHIENDLEFLKKMSFYLQDGGMLYLTVPSYQILWSNEDKNAGHFRRYTLNKVVKLLDNAGFTVIYKSYFFSFLPVPIFFFRTIPDLLFRNRSQKDPEKEHTQKVGLVGKVINYFLGLEKQKIQRLKTYSFGGSCIIVAKKSS